jgi:hypothetical protein
MPEGCVGVLHIVHRPYDDHGILEEEETEY